MSGFNGVRDSSDWFNCAFDDLSFYEKIGNIFGNVSENERVDSSEPSSSNRKRITLEDSELVLKRPKIYDERDNYELEHDGNCDNSSTEVNFGDLRSVGECENGIKIENVGNYYAENTEVHETLVKEENDLEDFDQLNYNVYNENYFPNYNYQVVQDSFHSDTERQFVNLDDFNCNSEYYYNYCQTAQENQLQVEEDRFWEDEVSTLFSQDVKCLQLGNGLNSNSFSDSVDSSTYDFVHGWCEWLDSTNEKFDIEEECLLKSIRKDRILGGEMSEDTKEIHRIAFEARRSDINSISQGAWESDHEDDATGKKRDVECDKIALKYNRPWRRRELNKQGVDGPLFNQPYACPTEMKAYTLSGQCYTIDLTKYRPSLFQDHASMKMWDHATRVNASRLAQNIEEGSFFPSELDRKTELHFLNDIKNIAHEASKLAKFFEKSHSDILSLMYHDEIILLYNFLLVFDAQDDGNCESLGITKQLVDITFDKLSFVRQPFIVETIYEMLVAVFSGFNYKSDAFMLLEWLEEKIFGCTGEYDVFEVFAEEKKKYDGNVENLTFPQIMALTTLPQRKLNECGLKPSYHKLEATQNFEHNLV